MSCVARLGEKKHFNRPTSNQWLSLVRRLSTRRTVDCTDQCCWREVTHTTTTSDYIENHQSQTALTSPAAAAASPRNEPLEGDSVGFSRPERYAQTVIEQESVRRGARSETRVTIKDCTCGENVRVVHPLSVVSVVGTSSSWVRRQSYQAGSIVLSSPSVIAFAKQAALTPPVQL